MNTRLLLAGLALTLLAFQYDAKKSAGLHAGIAEPATTKVWSSIGHAFDAVLADAVRMGVSNSMATLVSYEPAIKELRGDQAQRARKLAKQVKTANEKAKQQLTLGNTGMALDFAIQASTHEDALRKMLFERR
jgi:hypothetical protein